MALALSLHNSIVCWFFVEMSSSVFPCGGGCSLVLREDLPELETVAKKFEQDEGFLEKLQHSIGNEDLLLLPAMFPIEEDEYFPFCDINIEVYPDNNAIRDPSKMIEFASEDCTMPTSTANIPNSSDTPLSFAASTLCSFRDHDSTHPNNVRTPTLSKCFPLSSVEVLPLNLFTLFLQVQAVSNSNLINSSDDTSYNTCQSSLSNFSNSECLSFNQGNQPSMEDIPSVDHCSDDSDSEIFRVKRRSTLKVERKNVISEIKSDQIKHQVSLSLGSLSLCSLFVLVI